MFPGLRGVVELPHEALKSVLRFIQRTRAGGFGLVAKQPRDGELYQVGTFCRVVSHSLLEEADIAGKAQLVVEGLSRFQVIRLMQAPAGSPFLVTTVQMLEEPQVDDGITVSNLVLRVQRAVLRLLAPSAAASNGRGERQVRWPASSSVLVDIVGTSFAPLSLEERQQILEIVDVRQRLELVLFLLEREADPTRVCEGETPTLAWPTLGAQQPELHSLRDAGDANAGLGDCGVDAGDEDEVTELESKITRAGLAADAARIARSELRRLKAIQPHHPEYCVSCTYLETLSSLPWTVSTADSIDLAAARAMLDAEHCGLRQVKTRILEFLAVQKLRGCVSGPILCLHGPPGIGKTSLGSAIARALGRKFHRIALGGLRDEAELRGHRRTYIGSGPGVIIQALQALGTNNPVMLLDEVDKLAQGAGFNPSAALLEILDPEQNANFKDHYLNTTFDLSRVVFICTANDTSLIDRALRDRMEILDLPGYTIEEKVWIATTHLLPKQRRLHALEADPPVDEVEPSELCHDLDGALEPLPGTTFDGGCIFAMGQSSASAEQPRLAMTPDAITSLVTKWTAESGVRSLERHIAQICRWAALRLQGVNMPRGAGTSEAAMDSCGPDSLGRITVDAPHLPHIVGIQHVELDFAERLTAGVAMGLAVSAVGAQLLFVETTRAAGRGRLTVTGRLGLAMAESVEAAMSLLRDRLACNSTGCWASPGSSGLTGEGPFSGEDIHVHFPSGSVPKDGPSAGLAVLLALASLHLDRPLCSDTAVTGEITLRGHVLPVGGIRDKVLAAHRAGVKHVLLPLKNRRQVLEDVPAKTLEEIRVHYMKHVDDALAWMFGSREAGAETWGEEPERMAAPASALAVVKGPSRTPRREDEGDFLPLASRL